MITFSPGVPLGVTPPDDSVESLIASEGGIEIGFTVWRVERGVATVDVVVSVADDDRDADVLTALRARALDLGVTTMALEVAETQDGLQELLRDAPVLSRYMVKTTPAAAPALPEGFAARAMTDPEYAAWERESIDGYTTANLARCGGDRELARQRSEESFARYLPDGAATADTRLLTLTQAGDPVGYLWLRHHRPRHHDPAPGDDQTFTFDVEVAAGRRGEGLGRAAMLAAEAAAVEVGDGQLGLNVFADNATATGLYRSLGYTPRSWVVDVALR